MDQKTLTVEAGEWSPVAAEYIGRALVDASPAEIAAQVSAGAALFYVYDGREIIGCYVLRIDQTETGRDGVIVAAGGDHCGADLVAVLLPYMESQFSGVSRIRIHTSRPGMSRKLLAQSYKPSEIVFTKAINAS